MPPMHCSPCAHSRLHAPQLLLSPCKSKQPWLQLVWPIGHVETQVPLLHTCVELQVTPHPPQLAGSELVNTHWLPHEMKPGRQRQVPMKQPTEPLPQTLPHEPQLLGSMAVSVQVPLHSVKKGAQVLVHMPSWQT